MPRIGVRHGLPLLATLASLTFAHSAQAQENWAMSQQHGTVLEHPDAPQGPAAAMGARGDAVLAWSVAGESEAVDRLPGGVWSAPRPLGPGGSPSADVAADGGAGVAFVQVVSPANRIRVALRDASGAWSASEIVAAGNIGAPRFAIGSGGRAAVGWVESQCGQTCTHRIQVSVRSGGDWQPPDVAVDGLTMFPPEWELAADADGGLVVAAVERRFEDELEERMIVATATYGDAWTSQTPVSPWHEYMPRRSPAFDVNDAGDAALGWTGSETAWVARRPAGGVFGQGQAVAASRSSLVDVSVGDGGDVAALFYAWTPDDQRFTQVRNGPAGGALSAPETLVGPVANVSFANLEHLDGEALFIAGQREVGQNPPRSIAGGIRFPGETFFSIDGPPTDSVFEVVADGDRHGNAVVMWTRLEETSTPGQYDRTVNSAGMDHAPPTLDQASFPASGTAGLTLPFSAQASDVWSPVELLWDFGDGTTATGSAVDHAYGGAGSYGASVTATDPFGQSATAGPSTVDVAPGATPPDDTPGPGDPAAPGGPGGGSADSGAPVTPRPEIVIRRITRRLHLRIRGPLFANRRGIVPLRLTFDAPVRGSMRLVDRAGRTLGRGAFRSRGNGVVRARIVLRRAALRRLRRVGQQRVRLVVVVASEGVRGIRLAAPVTLRLPR